MHFTDAAGELLSVPVNGTEHSYEATVDTDHDGIADTVHVETADGSYDYTDTDHDGVADTLTEYDTQGHETGHATFDPATGNWETDDGGLPAPLQQDVIAAVPTIDSDGDGTADTSLTHTPDGTTVLATDTDGDGSPDVVTTISGHGDVTTYERLSDHSWQATGHGSLSEGGPGPQPEGHALIDPTTGAWTER